MSRAKIDFGVLFGENVEGNTSQLRVSKRVNLERSSSWEKEDEASYTDKQISPWRLVPIFLVSSLVFLALFARSFKLQIIDGASFLNVSEGNHVQIKVDHAPRGVIFDRTGKVLARNKPGFRIAVRKIDLPDNWEEQIGKVSSLLSKDKKEYVEKIKTTKTDSVTLASDVDNDQVISLKAEQDQFPWLDIEINPLREYPFGEVMAPLIGYTGEASVEDLKRSDTTPYSAGDQVGRGGIEASFEKNLRGANGYQLVKVDSTGKQKGAILTTEAAAGGDVTLSVDSDLQKFLYDNLKEILKVKGGTGASAIVTNPFNGEVLALVSLPSYDDNLFSKVLTENEYNSLINNGTHPLLNRPIGSSFPPGSTFKLLTATAGLESGKIKPDSKIEDTGFVQLGEQVFNNWLWLEKQKTEGSIDVVRALQRSNDTFFFKLGQQLGIDVLDTWALKFGFGAKTGIELPAETAGLVPTPSWKEKTFDQVWFPGETLNMSIGQGYLLVSPLQINNMTAVFANGGKLLQPTIVRTNSPKIINDNLVKPETLSTVREGMYENTQGDGNVSFLFKNFRIKSAGKTGSAESGTQAPHAWYTAYAPLDNPQIVITIMVENVGHGADVCAPLVKKFFDWYFKK